MLLAVLPPACCLQAMIMCEVGPLSYPDDLSEVVHPHRGTDVHGEGAAAVAALLVRDLPVLRLGVLLIPPTPLASVLPRNHQHVWSARQYGVLSRSLLLFALIYGPQS